MGGLSLSQLLQAEEAQGRLGHKALVMVYLTGGPPHQDLVDLKIQAPSEIRGEFKPINTNVPGIEVSELLPRCAAMIDKFAVIRSIVGAEDRHSSYQCVTGRLFRSQPQGAFPEIGSVLSRLQGPVDASVPPSVDLSMHMAHLPYNLPGAGFLGAGHSPFKPSGEAMQNMVLNGVTVDRLGDRGRLLSSFEQLRRQVDARVTAGQTDQLTERALGILTSSKLVEALDLTREDPKVRERYGHDVRIACRTRTSAIRRICRSSSRPGGSLKRGYAA